MAKICNVIGGSVIVVASSEIGWRRRENVKPRGGWLIQYQNGG